MNIELVDALKQLEREKNINPQEILEALEAALASAYRKNYHVEPETEVRVEVNPESGNIKVFAKEEGEEEREITPENFGRIAAQTAKQVILQRIREAERGVMYEEYRDREGDIVTGIVQQSDPRYILISLGKVEALLPPSEQVSTERYRHGTRLKAYIIEVRKTTRDPQIVVSRSHPGLLKRLFELEVPEITDGFVEIKSVAREPGSRSKIGVWATDPNVDPVGACVGPRGSRVRMVVSELWGEKIDVVSYSENPADFVASSLSPAKVKEVNIDQEEHSAEVIVPDNQLSLAIGKEGQNARLAAKLTGWRIDIKSETQIKEGEEGVSHAPEEQEEQTVDNGQQTVEKEEIKEKETIGKKEQKEQPVGKEKGTVDGGQETVEKEKGEEIKEKETKGEKEQTAKKQEETEKVKKETAEEKEKVKKAKEESAEEQVEIVEDEERAQVEEEKEAEEQGKETKVQGKPAEPKKAK